MNDNPNSKEVVTRMLQACKNVIFATSNLNSPEDIAKDTYALENTEICLSIILEAYESLDKEEQDKLSVVSWKEIRTIIQQLHKQEKTSQDYCKALHSYKNDLPKLKEKLEARLAQMS